MNFKTNLKRLKKKLKKDELYISINIYITIINIIYKIILIYHICRSHLHFLYLKGQFYDFFNRKYQNLNKTPLSYLNF